MNTVSIGNGTPKNSQVNYSPSFLLSTTLPLVASTTMCRWCTHNVQRLFLWANCLGLAVSVISLVTVIVVKYHPEKKLDTFLLGIPLLVVSVLVPVSVQGLYRVYRKDKKGIFLSR